MSGSLFIIPALLVVHGVMSICNLMQPMGGMKKYTTESIKRWLRPSGVVSVLGGIGLGCFNAYVWGKINITLLLVVGIIGIFILVFGTVFVMKKYLVRK